MLDLNKEVADLLKGIAPVELAGSEKELELPMIYIQSASNSTEVEFENKDFYTRFIFQIDIYAETPQKCVEMAKAVNEKMQKAGFSRTNGKPFGRQRYMLTYSVSVSEKLSTYKGVI